MALRISEQVRYGAYVNNTNQSLARLMELGNMEASQKKVNSPSDDPSGSSRILSYRDTLEAIKQYNKNVDTAKGWLSTADSTMLLVNTNVTRLMQLAEQASTGTISEENRLEGALEARQIFEQLINLANKTYDGQHIFAGHKTGNHAFVETLALSSNDPAIGDDYVIEGDSDTTILVQFLDSGEIGAGAVDDLSYHYTTDNGLTWQNGTLAAGDTSFMANGVRVSLADGTQVIAVDTEETGSKDNGTWLWIRPSAIYCGDDNNTNSVDMMGSSDVASTADGVFKNNITVRIDNTAPVGLDGTIEYSYSMDGGITWTTGNTVSTGTEDKAVLPVPGGFLNLEANTPVPPATELVPGDQFTIHPRRADMSLNVAPDEYLIINNIGKDIFGGLYQTPGDDRPKAVDNGVDKNLFEVAGELVGYLETNNQDGVQRCLAALNECQKHLTVKEATIGARTNRLTYVSEMLTISKDSTEGRLSYAEDVNLPELLAEISKQNLIYESVLKSSSMIMRTSLLNYL